MKNMFLLGRRKGSGTTSTSRKTEGNIPSTNWQRIPDVVQTCPLLNTDDNKPIANIMSFLDPCEFMLSRQICVAFAETADEAEYGLWEKMELRLYPWAGLERTWTTQEENEALENAPWSDTSPESSPNQLAKQQFISRLEHFWDAKAIKRKYKESKYLTSARIPGLVIIDKFRKDLGSDKPLFANKIIFDGQVYKGRLACVDAAQDILGKLGWKENLSVERRSLLAKLYTQEALFPFSRFQHFITMVLEDDGNVLVSLTIFFETDGRCDVTVSFKMDTGACNVQSVKTISTG
eukprot:gb/GECH01001700.1/.p1 GENE.gb/GECH01001700.1/~~gb/GECH01001700.1/.p1  ORF type:complete len:292 (+),score=50.41 gb/GECH01001700.1/:1-876(+)